MWARTARHPTTRVEAFAYDFTRLGVPGLELASGISVLGEKTPPNITRCCVVRIPAEGWDKLPSSRSDRLRDKHGATPGQNDGGRGGPEQNAFDESQGGVPTGGKRSH